MRGSATIRAGASNPKHLTLSAVALAALGVYSNSVRWLSSYDPQIYHLLPVGRGNSFLLRLHSELEWHMDRLIVTFDRALRTLTGTVRATRLTPAACMADGFLADEEKRLSGALMRVNHAGEVCAQALYSAQALVARDHQVRTRFDAAAREEEDHLAWTKQRLIELNARPSILNPLWYCGSFAIGAIAGISGDRANLGFVAETERQVEAHLGTHLDRLPERDKKSRAIVETMCVDEARHGDMAREAGALALPPPLPALMWIAAGAMRALAFRF